MSVSRADRRLVLPALAAVTVFLVSAAALAPSAQAQTTGVQAQKPSAQIPATGPLRLSPPVRLSPINKEPQKNLPAKQPPAQSPPTVDSGGAVQIDNLKTISPDTVGILSPEEGGFGPGLWRGSSGRFIETMLLRMPVNAASSVMRDLMRRLLLTPAALPPDLPGDGSLVVRRVGLLTEMGEVAAVSKLLDAIPGRDGIPQLARYETDIRFLANDNARACALAAGQIGKYDDPYWQKAFIFCQALAGERDKAALGVSLLHEVGEQDKAFFVLMDRLSGVNTPLQSLADPTPLLLSMARAANVQLPADVVSSNRPGILRTIATSPNAPVEIRLEAAERAEAAGALNVDTLRQLYSGVSFSAQDLANPLSRAEAESGPLSRALLYRTALVQTVPTAQAEVVAKALALARKGGRYASTVRVFMPILKKLPPSTALLWFAPEAIRAFLINGDAKLAQPWFNLLKGKAMFDKNAAAALDALLPIASLAGSPQAAALDPKQLARWWAVDKNSEGGVEKAALLYSLLEAMGQTVPGEAWEKLLDGPQRTTVVMPTPALWNRLQSAVKAATVRPAPESIIGATPETVSGTVPEATTGLPAAPAAVSTPPRQRFGEALLLSLIALGEGGPGQAAPVVLNKVIGGLRVIGLEPEARAMALEAAVAAGL